jgi:hypothetical protein
MGGVVAAVFGLLCLAVAMAMHAENWRLRAALRSIYTYGRANPGYGYSCATMAQAALGARLPAKGGRA